MSARQLRHENDFDKMLKGALRARSLPVPGGFTDKVLKQIQSIDEQKMLAKVILQERLALAVCIIIPVATAVAVFAYPQIPTTAWMGLKSVFYTIAKQVALMPHYNWQFGLALLAVIAFAAYNVLELLFANR